MASRAILFGEWAPDLADLGTDTLDIAQNVYPGPNGYKPVAAPVPQGTALPADCKGMFYAQKSDGSFDTYAATAVAIYRLDSSDYTWDDVTRSTGGDYACPADDFWRAAQFGTRLILTNIADDPQYIDVDSGTNFAPLGDSPGPARFVAVMDNRVVLAALSGDPQGIKWSDINDSDNWSSGVADGQTFPENGPIQAVFPNARLILQQHGTRQIIFTGDEQSFQFQQLTTSKGSVVPFGSVELGGVGFWLADDGIYLGNANEQRPISHNRITQYFYDQLFTGRLWQVNGAHDPFAPRIMITYPTVDRDFNDRILVYDWSLDRWSEIVADTFVLSQTAVPGVTLEGIESIQSNLDALAVSLDSRVWTGGAPTLAAIDMDGKLNYFQGGTMEAQFRTGAYSLEPGWRSRVRSLNPLIEADDATGTTVRIGKRSKMSAIPTMTSYISAQASGRHPANADARYHDFEYNIPAGTVWQNMQGFDEVDYVRTSRR